MENTDEVEVLALKVIGLCKIAESENGRLFAHKFNAILSGVVESAGHTSEPLRTEKISEVARRVHQIKKGASQDRRAS